ncbi:MAG TPA: hypothetical protein VH724_08615 [Candidatus Angelobacter sp.]|nr:hypothetical protein [Candidatus Angelobacter sp.]
MLSGITLFAVLSDHSEASPLKTGFAWVAGLIAAGIVVSANLLAFRNASQSVQRGLLFELTNKELVRRKSGSPDVRIELGEIQALYEGRGWLVVESAAPRKRIAVPDGVEGFAALRAELTKYGSVSAMPRRSVFAFSSLLASLICWTFVLWSKNHTVVKLAAAVVTVLLTWESLRLVRMMKGRPKRYFVWSMIAIGWITSLVVIYINVLRPR